MVHSIARQFAANALPPDTGPDLAAAPSSNFCKDTSFNTPRNLPAAAAVVALRSCLRTQPLSTAVATCMQNNITDRNRAACILGSLYNRTANETESRVTTTNQRSVKVMSEATSDVKFVQEARPPKARARVRGRAVKVSHTTVRPRPAVINRKMVSCRNLEGCH